ncbi:MAG: nitroreductase family protein [Christensenellales bacterium]|jgi:nitroreductase
MYDMEGLKPILERRSCRAYQDKPVPKDMLKMLLQAGMNAPSARDSQPWEFLVMHDYAKKKAVSELFIYWRMLEKASLGILVMANTSGYASTTKEFFIQDCAACTENILLAAQAMGLGGVWLGLYPKTAFMQKIRDIYQIPKDILPFSIVSIGYPAWPIEPHTVYRAEKVHTDIY